MKLIQLIPTAAIAALALAGCQETASDTAQDVDKAREESAEDVGAAFDEANKDVAAANADVASARQTYAANTIDARKKLTAAEA